MSQVFTLADVAKHNTAEDCWIAIDGKVYNVTAFLDSHPGGKKVIVNSAGKDASAQFAMFHKPSVLQQYGPKFLVGTIGTPGAAPTKPGKGQAPAKTERKKTKPEGKYPNQFGDQLLFGDPSWYLAGWNSPYYNESHRKFRAAMREFVDKEIAPFVHEWDEAKALPRELWAKCYEAGWLAGVCGGHWPVEYAGDKIAGGVKTSEWDHFHELILIDEVARVGSGGVLWALFAGLSIGLPPILNFGSDYLKKKVCADCIQGKKIIALAITEPWAGSDVASLRTTATSDGKYYVVNGAKKWITNGVFADYYSVAVRTGGPGMGGISMLLIERNTPGVEAKQMLCSGVWPSGTAYITFEDVKVPAENLIGKEGHGFRYVMLNFNHERFGIIVQASRMARVCLEEAVRYASKRETFGKRLIEHPVIRYKLSEIARHVEATHNWLESVTYQMCTMTQEEQQDQLGGILALLKAQATTTFELAAREAAQIFGGLSYTRGGQGEKIERMSREVRAYSIPAGSEEIMRDFAVRQAMKHNSKL